MARRLNAEAGSPKLPALFFMTDPVRTPDPLALARRLPFGSAVVYRHFGAPDRLDTARRLAALSASRGLILLIAADPDLAARVGANGVHWPEKRRPDYRTEGFALITAAAHTGDAVMRASASGADACILGPVFATRSSSGGRPLGLFRASQIARAAQLPVIALGGINAHTAARLPGRGFAGIAAVDALANG